MTGSTKRKTLVLLGLVLFSTVIIAANLSHLEFQPGIPLPSLQQGQLVTTPAKDVQYISISVKKFILAFFTLVLTVATLYSAYQLLRGANWKLIAEFLRYILGISIGIGCLVFLIMQLPGSTSDIPAEIFIPTPEPVITSPLGDAPVSLLWLVGMATVAIGVLMVTWIFTSSHQTSSIDLVRLEAENARQALISGMDLKDVIVHCYRQMSQAMEQERGIERKEFMTTGDFEKVLEAAGIHHEPIHQLTQLFDAVRYGNWQPNAADEQKALQCLEAIMDSHDARGVN